MILLEPSSKVLEESIRERLTSEPERCRIILADFDGVTYRISTPETKTTLLVSVAIRCFADLRRYGADAVLQREYGAYLAAEPETGFDVTLRIPLDQPVAEPESLIKSIALLKRNIMAAPFEAAFAAQQEGRESELMAIHYRAEEAIYVKGLPDRVTVIFSTEFTDETDKIYGKVFLQEFVDARRLPAIQTAPQVLYSAREPPLELRGVSGLKDSNTVGYVTFVLSPRHYQGALAYDVISRIQLFRDYFHFHIKASKAYMHTRMRARVDSFLKVLNRAKPEKSEDQKEKKTASGKTFKRS